MSPLDKLCEESSAHLAFRLRCEYLPGTIPFPNSPEETEWLGKRETLVVTVLRTLGGWKVRSSWTAGGVEEAGERDLGPDDLQGWPAEVEARGAWELPALSPVAAAEGTIEFEHEAYEYFDHDPDSLDLEAWRPPRTWRIQRGGNGTGRERTDGLLSSYTPLLPEPVRKGSAIVSAFKD